MLRLEEKQIPWKRLGVVAATGLLSVYTFFTLQGPHGLGALRTKLQRIQELQQQQADLKKTIGEKQRRVDSLEKGQNIEMEMRRFGRTLPDEIEYKVAEPPVADPDEDKE